MVTAAAAARIRQLVLCSSRPSCHKPRRSVFLYRSSVQHVVSQAPRHGAQEEIVLSIASTAACRTSASQSSSASRKAFSTAFVFVVTAAVDVGQELQSLDLLLLHVLSTLILAAVWMTWGLSAPYCRSASLRSGGFFSKPGKLPRRFKAESRSLAPVCGKPSFCQTVFTGVAGQHSPVQWPRDMPTRWLAWFARIGSSLACFLKLTRRRVVVTSRSVAGVHSMTAQIRDSDFIEFCLMSVRYSFGQCHRLPRLSGSFLLLLLDLGWPYFASSSDLGFKTAVQDGF